MEINEKTVKAKLNLAQHRRGISGREVDEDIQDERLPPGQHIVNNWPVLDLGYKPVIDLETWTLTIDGLIDQPVTWTWDNFQQQPKIELVTDFHCVTSWSQFDMAWSGVRFQHL